MRRSLKTMLRTRILMELLTPIKKGGATNKVKDRHKVKGTTTNKRRNSRDKAKDRVKEKTNNKHKEGKEMVILISPRKTNKVKDKVMAKVSKINSKLAPILGEVEVRMIKIRLTLKTRILSKIQAKEVHTDKE